MDIGFYDVLVWFGRHSAWLLLPAAVIIYLWILEKKTRKDESQEEWERKVHVSRAVKVFSFIGMIYGFFLMVGAVMTELTGYSPSLMYKDNVGGGVDVVNHFTVILYFVTGMAMFFKPLKDVPFASIISLTAATGLTILAMFTLPDNYVGSLIITYVMDLKWLLLTVFLVVLSLVYIAAKSAFRIIMFISNLISKPFFAFIWATLITVQAFLLLAFGISIVQW